jgi:hypothetical protein
MLKVNKNMTNVAPERTTVIKEKLLLLLVPVFS